MGIPSCPAGAVAQGETCVAATSAPVAPGTATTYPYAAPPPQPTPAPSNDVVYGAFGIPHRRRRGDTANYDGGPVPAGAHVESRPRYGLAGGGIALFGIGYVIALGTGYGGEAYYNSDRSAHSCFQHVDYAYVPVIGPILALTSIPSRDSLGRSCSGQENYGLFVGLAVVDAILQIGGFGMAVLGFATRTHRIRYDANNSAHPHWVEWSVLPAAPGASVGATFSITHF